nr:NADP oxidoreductase [Streptomyces rhizosphaericus]
MPGAGAIAQAIARHTIRHGHEVVLSNSRGQTVVIDATNQFASLSPNPEIADLGDLTGSAYGSSLLPGARVVKAFNSLHAQFIAPDPRHEAGRQVLFLAGDDADAKHTVRDLTSEFGFAPVDLGTLREGGRLIQLGGPLSALHVLKQD